MVEIVAILTTLIIPEEIFRVLSNLTMCSFFIKHFNMSDESLIFHIIRKC